MPDRLVRRRAWCRRALLVRLVLAAGLVLFVGVGLALLAASAVAEPRVFELAIAGGQLPEATRVMRVKQGDEVTLRWTTDRPVTIHLHGYDLEQKLTPGKPVAMRLTARATGRFPIEIHAHGSGGDRTLGYLEVHPR